MNEKVFANTPTFFLLKISTNGKKSPKGKNFTQRKIIRPKEKNSPKGKKIAQVAKIRQTWSHCCLSRRFLYISSHSKPQICAPF
jgi:hypothetical protein